MPAEVSVRVRSISGLAECECGTLLSFERSYREMRDDPSGTVYCTECGNEAEVVPCSLLCHMGAK